MYFYSLFTSVLKHVIHLVYDACSKHTKTT